MIPVMKCPCCLTTLRHVRHKLTEIDLCPRCRGVWFDSGELTVFVRSLIDEGKVTPEKVRLFERRKVNAIRDKAQQGRSCPRCDQKMRPFNYAYDSNVFIEKCPDCEGIWTDRGEIMRIASYVKEDPRLTQIGGHFASHQRRRDCVEQMNDLGGVFTGRAAYPMVFMPRVIVPLGDDAPCERMPLITWAIIVACTLVFGYQAFYIQDHAAFFEAYGFIPGNFFSVGLLTSMFLHGGLWHLLGNMLFLWIFGDNVEDRFTRAGYVGFYLACGLAAHIMHAAFNWNLAVPCIGASGAVSGIMGAYLIFHPRANIRVLVMYRIVNVSAYVVLSIWFAMQLFYSILHHATGFSNVAWFAHIGGFVFGVAFAFFKKRAAPQTQ